MTATETTTVDRPAGPQPGNLAAALAAFQARLPQIRKGETAKVKSDKGNYEYTYANLADISAQVMPLLGEFGLSFLARPTFSGDRFVLAYELLHASGESKAGEYPLPSGGTPQALGSAITYGRRYTLCAVTGVSPDDADDDGAAAQAAARDDRQEYQRQGPPPPLTENSSPRDIRAAIKAEGDHRSLSVQELAEDFYARTGEQIRDAAGPVLFGYRQALVNRVTDGQHKQMHALWKQAEITDRDARIAYTSEAVGREIASSADLTKAEAAAVIGKLTAFVAQSTPGQEPAA